MEVLTTQTFDRWLRKLKDRQARLRILARLDRLANGNFGDVKPLGMGISEVRLVYGPGYRLYFAQQGNRVVLLLCGGDKSSQSQDIVKARLLAARWYDEEENRAE